MPYVEASRRQLTKWRSSGKLISSLLICSSEITIPSEKKEVTDFKVAVKHCTFTLLALRRNGNNDNSCNFFFFFFFLTQRNIWQLPWDYLKAWDSIFLAKCALLSLIHSKRCLRKSRVTKGVSLTRFLGSAVVSPRIKQQNGD